jgi:hypothetical protein
VVGNLRTEVQPLAGNHGSAPFWFQRCAHAYWRHDREDRGLTRLGLVRGASRKQTCYGQDERRRGLGLARLLR